MGISDVTSKINESYTVFPGHFKVSVAGVGAEGRGVSKKGSQALSEKEKQQVEELKKRDREVRAHEAAHVAAGGQYVRGGASYTYQSGPDGNRYAVGGEVSIDVSPVSGDPEATIAKMRVVKRAAMAPANPSGADQSVAAAATAAELKAQQELMSKKASSGPGAPAKSANNFNTDFPVQEKVSASFNFQKVSANAYASNSQISRNNPLIPANSGFDVSA